jgi:hypothetical protein
MPHDDASLRPRSLGDSDVLFTIVTDSKILHHGASCT